VPTTGLEIEKESFDIVNDILLAAFIFSNVEKEEAVACFRAL
jgi:hypothetical protein